MSHTKHIAFILAGTMLASAVAATPAFARDLGDGWLSKERFQIRARAIGVLPDDSSSVNIGGDVDVGDAVTPEVDLTYFITPHIAVEAIAATAQHSLTYTGNVDVGETWILPPTVTLQYHFTPNSTFSPYLGAGLNHSWFYGEEEGRGFTNLDVEGGVGFALQAGADLWINENLGLNLDVKKLFLDVDASVNLGATAIRTDIDLDPWIVGAGVSYRF
jgi:outer membrane protein